jgi:hypothetical protein
MPFQTYGVLDAVQRPLQTGWVLLLLEGPSLLVCLMLMKGPSKLVRCYCCWTAHPYFWYIGRHVLTCGVLDADERPIQTGRVVLLLDGPSLHLVYWKACPYLWCVGCLLKAHPNW